jgi:hypothetical protein
MKSMHGQGTASIGWLEFFREICVGDVGQYTCEMHLMVEIWCDHFWFRLDRQKGSTHFVVASVAQAK